MRHFLLALPLLIGQLPAAQAQVSVGIGVQLPGVSIGINLPAFPDLERVPGYPVYYAPQGPGNYFFYDGLYWVFVGDEWYASSWYNGPWRRVGPYEVPLFVLRVPVRYYRQPPPYFGSWQRDAAPRWGEHWGNAWQQRRPGWDRWDRRAVPAPAPAPEYQRKFPQSRYPDEPAQQQSIRSQNYRYQPREPVPRQQFQLPERSPSPNRGEPATRGAAPDRRAEPAARGPAPGRAEAPRRGQDDGRPGPRQDGRQGDREPGRGGN